ncbi:MAG: hypothetical protein J3K34DRAFT_445000 [Monoraphidium minutum]|nr:MAG: hypothetical protein J3K34DRAFT_445000 [Monoraphidium minutum]
MASLLVKLGTMQDLESGRLYKELPDRCLVTYKQPGGEPMCVELPDAAQRDTSDLLAVPGSKAHRVICDSDGTLRIALIPKSVPIIDKSGPRVGDGYGLGGPDAAAGADAPHPPPLVPFAGLDRKPMPPSPAKPFAMQASPIKPSPMKERIDSATTAVASKTWGARQKKMSEFFTGAKASAKPAAPAAAPAPAPAPRAPVLGTVADMDF